MRLFRVRKNHFVKAVKAEIPSVDYYACAHPSWEKGDDHLDMQHKTFYCTSLYLRNTFLLQIHLKIQSKYKIAKILNALLCLVYIFARKSYWMPQSEMKQMKTHYFEVFQALLLHILKEK